MPGRLILTVPAALVALAGACVLAGVLDGDGAIAVVITIVGAVAVLRRQTRLVAEARHQALTDSLTDLGNRRRLIADLEQALEDGEGSPRAFALFDLDGFKGYNDRMGHQAGDALLARLGTRLAAAVEGHGTAYRMGGDEFCALVDAGTLPPPVLLERATEALREQGENGTGIGSSAGLVVVPAEATTSSQVLRLADDRMYATKRRRNVHGGDALDRSICGRLELALERGDLELHYQPIVRLATREVQGVEALVRWRDESGRLILPGEFIPAAERTGMIDAVGHSVVIAACRQARAWEAEGLLPRLGLNVSPPELERPSFATRYASTLLGYGVGPDRVVAELTESTWMDDSGATVAALAELRDHGLRLALDDFGAGYSSLSRLLQLPVDIIKIDRALLHGVPDDPQARAILAAIVQLAEACGCDVVAEGVETAAQADVLVELGCALGQGFGLCRPLPAAEVTEALRAGLIDDRRAAPASPAPALGRAA